MRTKLLLTSLAALGLAALPVSALAGGPSPADEAKGSTLSGKVTYDGEAMPEMKLLDMSAKPEHAEHCSTAADKKDRSFLIDPATKGIANVYVEVRKATKADWEPKGLEIHVDQTACRFEPHVMVVPAKTTVKFLNSDPFMHNVNLVCKKNSGGNYGIPENGHKELEFKFSEKVGIRCDVHTWMSAWIVVTDNPFHALTGPDGSFAIPEVPDGTYEIRFWHETMGDLKKKKVEISGDTVLDVTSGDPAWKD